MARYVGTSDGSAIKIADTGGFPDAPADGQMYGRRDESWQTIDQQGNVTDYMTEANWAIIVQQGYVYQYAGHYVVLYDIDPGPVVNYIQVESIREDADGNRLVATDVGVKTIVNNGKAIEIEEFYSDVSNAEETSKVNTISTDGLVFSAVSETEIKISTSELDAQIEELFQDILTVNTTLPDKANIYKRLAVGITIGNNIKGTHIQAKEPFAYYNDWSYETAGNVKLLRTNNNLDYVDATGVYHRIVNNGSVIIDDYLIDDEFYITSMTGDPVNVNLIYRWFDTADIDQRMGTLSSLLTEDKSSLVDAINSLYDRVSALLTSSELAGSPFASYADFLVAYPTTQVGKYAYVAFLSTDTIPPSWSQVQVGSTWRLDGGIDAFRPTSNMTPQFSVILSDGAATNDLMTAGSHATPDIIQRYRDNLKYVIQQIDAHTVRTDNPHSVTATQVGLSNVTNTSDANKPVSTAQAAAIALKQDTITSTGTTNLLTAPSSSGGNPGTKAINTLLSAPEAQTANTQLLYAPATKGAVPTLKAVSDLLASPAAQTANTQILLAPATKGDAPTLLAVAPIVQRRPITGLSSATYTIDSVAHRTIQFTTMGSGTGRRFIRLYKVNTDGYNKARLKVTSRYIWSTEDFVWRQSAANTAPVLLQGAMQWDNATISRCHLFLATDTYMWIDYETTDLGGMKLILDVTADDPSMSEVIFQSGIPTAVGASLDLRTTILSKTYVTSNGITISYQRKGSQVYAQCSGNQITAGVAAYATMGTIPVGYRPSIQGPQQDSVYMTGIVNPSTVNNPVGFQLYTGLIRPMQALSAASYVIFGWNWITDEAWPLS
jgi:hypothetical protein